MAKSPCFQFILKLQEFNFTGHGERFDKVCRILSNIVMLDVGSMSNA
ncbi:hypothetical protein J15TS10_50730 [Paenibacillus woosongensis]|uniref:Uncharacterized protein n=1 Tax=Paenibacillus woosongensis TaxID=307580 RepID=A0ABQ4MZC8_9BACL|nr:hypothetical protein J15TS10_50730 [Paenibacillus woosongensis]